MSYPFIQAKNYTVGRAGKSVRMIVLHTMETPETDGRASNVAKWFAGETAPQASAHYCVDNHEVVQSVKDTDTAWAVAVEEYNEESISLELAGQASQTPAQWADTYSRGELAGAEKLSAELSKKYGIPAVHLTDKQILDGVTKGFCYHADISRAKAIAGGHTDPGVNFPLSNFLAGVAGLNTPAKGGESVLAGLPVKPSVNTSVIDQKSSNPIVQPKLPVVKVADVQPGKQGAEVKLVQEALIKVGLKPGIADGIFGRNSLMAYGYWQRECGYRGASADGAPGLITLTKLGTESGLFKATA